MKIFNSGEWAITQFFPHTHTRPELVVYIIINHFYIHIVSILNKYYYNFSNFIKILKNWEFYFTGKYNGKINQ